jgi:hypothetical protein
LSAFKLLALIGFGFCPGRVSFEFAPSILTPMDFIHFKLLLGFFQVLKNYLILLINFNHYLEHFNSI